MKLTFYTPVQTPKKGWKVKWIDPVTHEVNTFVKEVKPVTFFDDPAEAGNEFEACVGGESSCYLDRDTFNGKVAAFKRQRKQLEEWKAMSGQVPA